MKKIAIGIMAALLMVGCGTVAKIEKFVDGHWEDTEALAKKWIERHGELLDMLPGDDNPPAHAPKYEDEAPLTSTVKKHQEGLIHATVTHDLDVFFEGSGIRFEQTLTADLTEVAGSAGNVCMSIQNSDGTWGPWNPYDWIRVDQKVKARHEIGDVPSGTVVAFCVSSHFRQHWRNGLKTGQMNVRTKTVIATVP